MTTESSHKEKLKGLYAITDENLITEENFKQTVELALQGGTKIVQYRDKSNNYKKRLQQASLLQSLCKKYNAIGIINDDVDLARSINADGVHLGKDDASISRARQLLGKNSIIGVSCYNSLDVSIDAEKNGADYVAFGAMFSSPTKPDACIAELALITQAKQKLTVPVCPIGGITINNIHQLTEQDADMVAVISSLFSSDDIKKTAHVLSQHFRK